MDRTAFEEWVRHQYPHLQAEQLEQFARYRDLIIAWNDKINLVSRSEATDLYEKHLVDSLLFPTFEGKPGLLWIDLGSGAGFPGIPLKIAYPDITLYMLEPTKKRASFLQECVNQLGLTKTTVVSERAEIYANEAREMFDVLVARAVAPLNMLLELAAPLVRVGGFLYAYKGLQANKELVEADNAVKSLGLREAGHLVASLPLSGHLRHLLVFEKETDTPRRYPRAYAEIKRQPL